MLNALTIDVEEYFHVTAFARHVDPKDWDGYPRRIEKNTIRLLGLLAERNVNATFFIVGWVAERYPGLVKQISGLGHTIGCHSYSHRAIYEGSRDEFRSDVRRAKAVIENLIGRVVRSYRAPSYSITSNTLWALNILGEEGFEYDSSIYPIVHDLYGIPGAPRFPHLKVLNCGQAIKEFPPSTLRVFQMNFPIGGGGYLRLFPYWFTASAIRRLNESEKQPAMVYVHPWEIDPDQPPMPGPWRSRFRHYQNLHSTETKLKRLLNDFLFCPMEQVLATRTLQVEATGSSSDKVSTGCISLVRRGSMRSCR
jgi:polysaccharide deacetylase family protein (PEP-CTERM system associated)